MSSSYGPDHWKKIIQEVEDIVVEAGRIPAEIKIIPVTKGFDVDLIRRAYRFGFDVFGENRVGEYLAKKEELKPELVEEVEWHMIGHLQSNKVRKIVGEFDLIHSYDRQSLLKEFRKRLKRAGRRQRVLLQVNVSGEESKYGLSPEEAPALLEQTLKVDLLVVEGLMTMAPWTEDEAVLRKTFADCRKLRDELEQQFNIALPELSMGMTNDYKIAIEEGATMLRLGRALFGERPQT